MRRALALVVLAASLAAVGCDDPSLAPGAAPLSTAAPGEAETALVAPTTPAVAEASAPSAAAAPTVPGERPTRLPFTQWIVENCVTDAIAPSDYSRGWLRHPKPQGLLRPSDPRPLFAPRDVPEPGSSAAEEAARALEARWLAAPESHVVDCTFRLKPRRCKHCERHEAELVRLLVYLPQKLFTAPGEVDSLLLLVPGGEGGRSRAFLPPIPDAAAGWDSGAGGLDTKALADAFYAAEPEGQQSVIASLETCGQEHASGAIEFLSFDIEHHLRKHLLQREAPLRLGVDGVSSGARQILRAAFAKPDRFRTIGLSCMACGGVHPKKNRLGTREEVRAFAEHLAARRASGGFDLRIAIGERDNQLKCNRAFVDVFRSAGLIPEAELSTMFRVVPGALHDFAFLSQVYADQLRWHLDTLRRPDDLEIAATTPPR